MLAILNSLNAHNLPIFQPILVILVSKFMVHRALSDKTYLSLELLSPLRVKYKTLIACEDTKPLDAKDSVKFNTCVKTSPNSDVFSLNLPA